MNEEMKFPNTLDEFIKQYSFIDKKQIYTNGSELIHTFRIKQWEEHKRQKRNNYKEKYNKALQLLTEYNLPCEIDNFNTKEENLDYCSRNCSVDEEIYIKCWDRFIEQSLKEVE